MNAGQYIAENLGVVIGTIIIFAPFMYFLVKNSVRLGIFRGDYETLKDRVDLNGREIKEMKDARITEREEFAEIKTDTKNNGKLMENLSSDMKDLTEKVVGVLERMAAHDGKTD